MGRQAPNDAPRLAAGILLAGALAFSLAALPGCSDRDAPSVDAGPDAQRADVGRDSQRADVGPDADRAVAVLEPARTGRVRGTVEFEALGAGKGLRVRADVKGLPPGRHAFHVHEHGDCSAPDASSAGEHFAFEQITGAPDRITGNLGELETKASGTALLETVVPRARLDGPRSIVGRAVVVHAAGNDPSVVPDGGAGERIACGVIEAPPGSRS